MADIPMETLLAALLLTAAAGLSTTFGSLIALFWRAPGPRYMTLTLGFSAGIMIHVSYVELLSGSMAVFGEGGMSQVEAFAVSHVALFTGLLAMLLIDVLVSHAYILEGMEPDASLRRMGVLVAVGVAIHNFPEGMATFASAIHDRSLGVAIAAAIALHNVPEGIAVAVPIHAATHSARKAFLWSFLSGVSEPVGAALAAVVLLPFLSPAVLGWTLCCVAGFMIYIAFDELLPAAQSYGRSHLAIVGVATGMAVMALSLALL
jgi:ZIP family zinc transporter